MVSLTLQDSYTAVLLILSHIALTFQNSQAMSYRLSLVNIRKVTMPYLLIQMIALTESSFYITQKVALFLKLFFKCELYRLCYLYMFINSLHRIMEINHLVSKSVVANTVKFFFYGPTQQVANKYTQKLETSNSNIPFIIFPVYSIGQHQLLQSYNC